MNTVSTHRKSVWVAAGLLVTLSLIAATSAAFAQSAAVTQPPSRRQIDPSQPETARDDQVMVPETATDAPPARR